MFFLHKKFLSASPERPISTRIQALKPPEPKRRLLSGCQLERATGPFPNILEIKPGTDIDAQAATIILLSLNDGAGPAKVGLRRKTLEVCQQRCGPI
jgi:hypothetical protein